MKVLENKTTTIKDRATGQEVKYSDLIKLVCNMPVQGGYTISDISMRTKIMEACEKANGVIEVEDLRVDYLKAITATAKWPFIHADLVGFVDDIKDGWKSQ